MTAPGKANLAMTGQFACRAIRPNLKRLFAKCTTAVVAMARGCGKNRAKTGIRIVPSPKPENNVSPDASTVAIPISTSSSVLTHIVFRYRSSIIIAQRRYRSRSDHDRCHWN